MADEAAVAIVMRARDEASSEIANVGNTMTATEGRALQMNVALVAMGSALSTIGSMLSQVDDPLAKMAGSFLATAGAMLTSVSAIMMMLPRLKELVIALRGAAVVSALLAGLTGIGLKNVFIGIGAAALVAGALVGANALVNRGRNDSGTTVNINAGVLMGDRTQAKELARMVKQNIAEDTRLGR